MIKNFLEALLSSLNLDLTRIALLNHPLFILSLILNYISNQSNQFKV